MATGTELTDPSATSSDVTDEKGRRGDRSERVPAWWRDAASLSMLLALLVWAVPFTHAGGGRDPFVATYALLALVPALVLVRPWRVLVRLDLLALAPAAAGLFACFFAPTGFDGLAGVVAFAYAGLLFVLVRGYLGGTHAITRSTRLALVTAALLIAGADQFLASWWAWYGRGDSSALLVGTFFWHNQFAIYLAALGLFGAVLAARGSGNLRWAGGAIAVLAVPSLAFAGSRATLALFVLAWFVLALVSVRRPRALVTLAVLPLVGLALAALLASPALMATSDGVAANLEQRETVTGNGAARLVFDRVAIELVADHPLTGTGAGSFGSASAPLLPARISQPTAYVHNGFLQAFVDGGVLLGSALAVATLLPLVVGLRVAWRRRLGRSGDTLDAVTLGALVAVGVLAVHSAVDTDWTYPSLLALYAILASVLLRPGGTSDPVAPGEPGPEHAEHAPSAHPARHGTALLVALVLALLVAVPASVRASAEKSPSLAVPTWARVAGLGVPVGDEPQWLRGATACTNRMRAELATPSNAGLQEDLDCTQDLGAIAPSVQIARARALTRVGEVEQGRVMADDLASRYGTRIPQLLVLQAALPADAGDGEAAVAAVRAVLKDPRVVASYPATEYGRSVLAQLEGTA